ncbi:hypothetical protein ACIBSV_49705 [Embleya sp. NPDC050154]|uniref:hypothetical protein n=1 Tax=Embleya sp. NPDC050154 TaxID=3363988 RepID=UPI0037AE5AD1
MVPNDLAAYTVSGLSRADQHAAHGNFRNRARLIAHTHTALERTGRTHVDQDVLRWAFSRLGSGS